MSQDTFSKFESNQRNCFIDRKLFVIELLFIFARIGPVPLRHGPQDVCNRILARNVSINVYHNY